MSRYQMPLLILCVLMISCSSNIVNAAVAAQTVDLFKPGETKAKVDGVDYPAGRQHNPSFDTYSLIDVNGNMAALAFGVYSGINNKQYTDLWARSFKYENKISDVIGGEWDTQVVVKKNNDPNTGTVLYGPKAVVKGSKVFSILITVKDSRASTTRTGNLFVGEVKGGGSITWNASASVKIYISKSIKEAWNSIYVSRGRGIVMGGKTLVFPLVAKNKESGKSMCTVIFSENDGNTWNFSSTLVISEDCELSSLLEWEESLLMVHAYPPPQKLYESKDMGRTWTEARGKLSHILLDKMDSRALRDIQDFVTATIEGKNVILHTRIGFNVNRAELQLWVADSSRIHYAGQIDADAVDEDSHINLLYAQDELFAMYSKGEKASRTVVLAHLSNQLDQIKSVLKTWEDVEKRISPPSLTNGLVGFLSNKSDTTTWEDEYLGVDATVKGSATKVDNGLKIALPGTQVVWPIGEQRDNQAYVFTDRGFTVVATVTIHNKPQNVTRLMGVELSSNGVYTGLSYDKDKQWKGVTADEGSGELNTWEEGKAYQVALIFKDGTGSAYIDGKRLGSLEDPVPPAVPNANGARDLPSGGSEQRPPRPSQVRAGESVPLRAILRVSIGDEQGGNQEKEGSQVTVTNVLLYTRPLDTSELAKPSSNNNNNNNTNNNTDNTNNDTNTDTDTYTNTNTTNTDTDTNIDNNTNTDTHTCTNTNTTNNNTDTDTNIDNNTNTDTDTCTNTYTNNNKNNKDDNSMYEHVSCLLLVLMGLLSLVTLC